MKSEVTNILLCGTGGQGILLASEIISAAAWLAGFDVKKSEVHGMAQRGGSVTSHVRFGQKVHSPLIEEGYADIILGMEKLEAVRWMHYLKKNGRIISADIKIIPSTVNTGSATYPDVVDILKNSGSEFYLIPALEIAKELKNLRVVNVVLIGALSSVLEIDEECWLNALSERVPPKALDVNIEAFNRGKELL
jgi:indolepyruvate ferredoxin oxidoreductase beta subunit